VDVACDEAIPRVAPEVAIRQIFAVHAPFLWRILRRLGVRKQDIEDVCQDVLIVVYRKLADFQGHGSMRTWLYSICVRTASDYRRRAHFRRERPMEELPEKSVPARQEQHVERREALDWLDSILDRMDDEKRAVFVLYEIEELPMSEIVNILACPLQTAYSRLHAARRHVEAAIRQEEVAAATAHALALRSTR
jgi:RNA polymerase sigma-70 factor (ECF subfamily)